MAKVQVGANHQAESAKRENLPANVMAEIVSAHYERITRDGFTKQSTGEVVPPSTKTYAVLVATLPESADPTKAYRHELGCGDVLIPSEDGTYLDDVNATTERNKKLQSTSNWGVYLKSLRTAGAENGMYGEDQDNAVADNVNNLAGTRFQVGYSERDGGANIGKYTALIATLVYNFGKQDVAGDMNAVITAVQSLLATAGAAGWSATELVSKLSVTAPQLELAKQSFASEDWIKSAEAGGAFKRNATGRFVKA